MINDGFERMVFLAVYFYNNFGYIGDYIAWQKDGKNFETGNKCIHFMYAYFAVEEHN